MRKVELKISSGAERACEKFDKAAVSILKANQISHVEGARSAETEREREFPGGRNFSPRFSISLPLAPWAKVEMSAALLSDQNSPCFRCVVASRARRQRQPGVGKIRLYCVSRALQQNFPPRKW
jgi:hypothetical protein